MIVPDINLLVYAYNARAAEHIAARAWWERCMNGTTPVGIPWVVSAGFVRLVTHPRVLQLPMEVAAATSRVRAWLDRPNVIVPEPGRAFGGHFLGFLDAIGCAGNLTTDAYLAALAVEHQAELHSNDGDFGRFAGLRWRNPLK